MALIFTLFHFYPGASVPVAQAADCVTVAVEVGYRDCNYPSGVGSNSEVTAEKPESKLWWNDGYWWASMWSGNTSGAYHIYRLNWATQTWIDTGVPLDTRIGTKADVLWDQAANKLYVVSHIWSGSGSTASAGQRGELFRYSYNAATDTYSIDSGFPVEVNDADSEALTIAKDSTGTLWVTYVQSSKVWVNHSIGGNDAVWGTPYVLPVGSTANVSSDDLSTIIAYNGYIGVMWSNQSSGATMHFAAHQDGTGDAAANWVTSAPYTTSGDDHINLKSLQNDSAGNLFALIKTSKSANLIVLLVCRNSTCTSASDWTPYTAYTGATGSPTRPLLLIDTSNRDLYVFVRVSHGTDSIYYKTTDLDNISFTTAGTDEETYGTAFIKSATETGINDPTSTKQNVSSSTGLVVMASDSSKRYYLHNCMSLTGQAGSCSTTQTPLPTVAFSSATYSAGENTGNATITVVLSESATAVVNVNYATGNGTATPNSDYTPTSGVLSFSPGETSKTFSVPLLDDASDEPNETVNLTLSNASNATLGAPSTATLTIEDDDPVPTVAFSSAVYNVNEGDGSAPVTVTLSVASGFPVTVSYTTQDGTATAGSDYTATSGTLVFAPGETSKSFPVAVTDDTLDEGDETVVLHLSSPHNSTLGALAAASLTLVDNDPPPTVAFSSATYSVNEGDGSADVTVMLSIASGLPVTVSYTTQDGTATAGSDYTTASGALLFAPGETSKSFPVAITDDAMDEGDETVALHLSSPQNSTLGALAAATLTLVDNDPPPTVQFSSDTYRAYESANTATITVSLSAASGLPITIRYATSAGTATAGSDYVDTSEILTFAPGETSKHFAVTINDDSVSELDETVILTITTQANVSLGTPSVATLTIIDDDSMPTVGFSADSYSVEEGAGSLNVTVNLNHPTNTVVSVQYATSDGTATAGSDYNATSGTVTFTAGETSKSFSVPLIDDNLDEPDESVNLLLSNPNNATLATAAATLTITDNDEPPSIGFSSSNYSATEDGGTITITLTLSAPSEFTITVNYASAHETATALDYMPVVGSLAFAPGEISKNFTVTILSDLLVEPDETFSLFITGADNASVSGTGSTTVTILAQQYLYLPLIR